MRGARSICGGIGADGVVCVRSLALAVFGLMSDASAKVSARAPVAVATPASGAGRGASRHGLRGHAWASSAPCAGCAGRPRRACFFADVHARSPPSPPALVPRATLQPQVTQTLFSTDFPLADKILAQKHQQDHFYVVHSA